MSKEIDDLRTFLQLRFKAYDEAIEVPDTRLATFELLLAENENSNYLYLQSIKINEKLRNENELLKTALNEMVDISSRINILQSDSI